MLGRPGALVGELEGAFEGSLTPREPAIFPLPEAPASAPTVAVGPFDLSGVENSPLAFASTPAVTSPEVLIVPSIEIFPVISPPRLSVLDVRRVISRATVMASLVQLTTALPRDLTAL